MLASVSGGHLGLYELCYHCFLGGVQCTDLWKLVGLAKASRRTANHPAPRLWGSGSLKCHRTFPICRILVKLLRGKGKVWTGRKTQGQGQETLGNVKEPGWLVIFLSAGSEKSMNHGSWDLRTKKSQGFEDLGDEFARLICSPKYQLSTISVPGLNRHQSSGAHLMLGEGRQSTQRNIGSRGSRAEGRLCWWFFLRKKPST